MKYYVLIITLSLFSCAPIVGGKTTNSESLTEAKKEEYTDKYLRKLAKNRISAKAAREKRKAALEELKALVAELKNTIQTKDEQIQALNGQLAEYALKFGF